MVGIVASARMERSASARTDGLVLIAMVRHHSPLPIPSLWVFGDLIFHPLLTRFLYCRRLGYPFFSFFLWRSFFTSLRIESCLRLLGSLRQERNVLPGRSDCL